MDPRLLSAGLYPGVPTPEEEALQAPRVDPIDMGVAAMTGGAGLIPRMYAAAGDGAAQYVMGSDLPYAAKLPLSMAAGHAVGRMTPDEFRNVVPGGAMAAAGRGKPLNVLSLFDGIGGARVSLDRAGIPVEKYASYEINPAASEMLLKNYPTVIRGGDVRDFTPPFDRTDLLCAGFPCQDLSRANTSGQGLRGDRSGLFYDMMKVFDRTSPKNFIVENVLPKGSTRDADLTVMAKALGVEPTFLDAADFSAMARPRVYFSNIPIDPYVPSTARFADALDATVPDKYLLTDRALAYLQRTSGGDPRTQFEKHGMDISREKARTMLRVLEKGSPHGVVRLADGTYRRITPEEVEGLMGFPRGYTAGFSDAKRYGALGNSWSIPTVAHILRGLKRK